MFNYYTPNHEIQVDDEVIECVQECIYLRLKISVGSDHEKEES